MTRRLISSGSSYERDFGYSRAVVVDRHVYVAGTAPIMADGGDPPDDPYAQAARCLEIITAALAEAGATPAHVVRTHVYVSDAAVVGEVMRAHGETFADARPACTGVVTGLFDPKWYVEIEAEALLPDAD